MSIRALQKSDRRTLTPEQLEELRTYERVAKYRSRARRNDQNLCSECGINPIDETAACRPCLDRQLAHKKERGRR
jgi:hypothetical protein